jgi:hypothetical protein
MQDEQSIRAASSHSTALYRVGTGDKRVVEHRLGDLERDECDKEDADPDETHPEVGGEHPDGDQSDR